MFCLPGRTRRNGSPASSTEIVASDAPGPRRAGDHPVALLQNRPPAGTPPSDATEKASMASSSAAEPSSRLSDRGTLATPDFVCVLKIQRLLGSIWCFVVPMGFLIWFSGGFCAAKRSSLGLRFMVLLMHLLFVGAVFILDPTLDWRIHEEPWYDSHS